MKVELYCEDNLDCLKRLKVESINLIYADILYGIGRKFNDVIIVNLLLKLQKKD